MLTRELEAFFGAVRFFTRLPVPAWVGHSAEGLNASARYFTAVGLIVGGVAGLVCFLASLLWPMPLAVLASMLATVLLTGAFHEDGLADMVDGLGGGWTREDALAIMKDSRIGSFGAIAIVLAALFKFSALLALAGSPRAAAGPALAVAAALVAGHALSRYASTLLLATLEYAREDAAAPGKSKPLATRLGGGGVLVATLFALLGLAAALPLHGLAAVAAGVALAALATGWLARKIAVRLGGYTGDCLGAVQQVAEIAFYLGLLCSFT